MRARARLDRWVKETQPSATLFLEDFDRPQGESGRIDDCGIQLLAENCAQSRFERGRSLNHVQQHRRRRTRPIAVEPLKHPLESLFRTAGGDRLRPYARAGTSLTRGF